MEVAPRGGAAWVGAVEAAAGPGAQGMVLPGTLYCSSGSGCGWGNGPDTILADGGNGGFRHILRPVWSEVFPAQTHPHGARLRTLHLLLPYVFKARSLPSD